MKLQDAIDFYAEADEELGFEESGYPACVGHLGPVIAIAESGHNGPELEMYLTIDFVEWMATAKKGFDTGEFDSRIEAVNETRIEPAVSDGH